MSSSVFLACSYSCVMQNSWNCSTAAVITLQEWRKPGWLCKRWGLTRASMEDAAATGQSHHEDKTAFKCPPTVRLQSEPLLAWAGSSAAHPGVVLAVGKPGIRGKLRFQEMRWRLSWFLGVSPADFKGQGFPPVPRYQNCLGALLGLLGEE